MCRDTPTACSSSCPASSAMGYYSCDGGACKWNAQVIQYLPEDYCTSGRDPEPFKIN